MGSYKKILIVEDNHSQRESIIRKLKEQNSFELFEASSFKEARQFKKNFIDLAIIDMNLEDGNGLTLLKEFKEFYSQTRVIIITGFGSIQTAVQALKEGAFHFMTKPICLDQLLSLSEKALHEKNLEEENTNLKAELNSIFQYQNIIGHSKKLETVMQMTQKVSQSQTSVLLTGESGTGKELFAKTIHYNSLRKDHPMVTVNCAAIPENLLESELFGSVKGAFTGAVTERKGRFEMAHKGSLFLDEIGDMDLNLQSKLLRVLENKSFEKVGSSKTISVDVRIIAATHQNLAEKVKKGEFRQDLFYRLNVFPIHIPSLSDRKDDVEMLLYYFIKKENSSLKGFSKEALSALKNYSWPGNVRELKNLVERLSIMFDAKIIEYEDLPENYKGPLKANFSLRELDFIEGKDLTLAQKIEMYENNLIKKALRESQGNKQKASKILQINRTTLIEKIKKRNIDY